jgi:putative transcriptional regulator
MNLIGNLIIAPPAVKNNFWHKTVILLTEHHAQGSIGLVINKRSELTIANFGKQVGFELDIPGYIYVGGPVNNKSLSFLHTNEWISKNTYRINDRFSISSAEDILPRLAMGDHPIKWRLFLGMCGWSPGQLIGEIKGDHPWNHNNSWCLATADHELVFGSDGKDQWCNALDRSGLEFAQNILT